MKPLLPRTARDPDVAVLVLGAAVLAAIAVVDVLLRNTVTLTPWVLIAPLYIATRGTQRETAVTGVAALAASVGLGAVDGTFGESIHLMHMALVLAGGTLAVITARIRRRLNSERLRTSELLQRERAERVRQEFASRASGLLEAPQDAVSMLNEVAGLAVPDMADLCIVDLLEPDGALKGVAVQAADPAAAAGLRDERMRAPIDPSSDHPVAIAARTGEAALLAELPDEDLRRYATSPEHLDLMRRLHYRSAIVAPLIARGRTIGVMSLLRFVSDAAYDEHDFRVAFDLARRAALAIDNARLFRDLRLAEGQLDAILKNLSEAVTVQDASGELVYANQAAADIMGSATPEELIATPVEEIGRRFWQYDEDGKPFPPEAYPGRLALLGERPSPVVLRQVSRDSHEERWVRLSATPVVIPGGGEPVAVTVTEDITDVYHAERTQRFLANASKLLASSLDVTSTIEKVAWAVVPEVADWCVVHMADERGRLRAAAVAHMDAGKLELARELQAAFPPATDAERGPSEVLRSGDSQLYPYVTEELLRSTAQDPEQLAMALELGMNSALIAPLFAGDEPIGTITLVTVGEGRRLGAGEVRLTEELGRRAGVAIENARVHAARSHIATTLQRSLLPPRLPEVPGLALAARFRAAGVSAEVGGDFYDLFPAPGGWMVVIGDVTGKGPVAAAITSLARYTLRTAAMYERTPEQLLARLNEVLLADPERRQLCTAVCAHVRPAADGVVLRVACAGHPAPYLLRSGAEPEQIGRAGSLLGAFDNVAWIGEDVELHEGDTVVLYTDGVTDTSRADGERFGQERLTELLSGCTGLQPEDVAQRIDAGLVAFEEGPQRDDIAVLVLRAGEISR